MGESSYGFFYDSKTNRYFSDGRSTFSIRPVEDQRFLEKIEISLDGGEFELYQGKLKFDKEGLHQIRFRASDPVLNWSPIQEFRVYVDLTPPKSAFFWQGALFQKDTATFVSPTSQLVVAAQDSVSGVAKTLVGEGQAEPAPFTAPMRFKAEGDHVIKFASVDHVGNQEPWQELRFSVDSKPPVTEATINGFSFKNDKGVFVNSGSEIVLTAKDEESGVKVTEFQVNGGPVTEYRNPISVTDKRVELKYRSVDNVANAEAWKSMILVQDTTPPQIAIEKSGTYLSSGGRIFATPGFAFVVKATDSETGIDSFEVTRDGKTFQKVTDTKFTFDQPGEYQFALKAVDKVGNIAEGNPYTVVIDNQPPKTVVKTQEKLVEKDGVFISSLPNQIDFTATDDAVGVDHTEISFDGKNFVTVTRPIDPSQWKEPRRTVYYRSVDRLGNREAPQKMDLVLRTTGPKVDLFVESENLPEVPLSQLTKSNGGARLPASTGGTPDVQPAVENDDGSSQQ